MNMNDGTLHIIPLGGLGEIGRHDIEIIFFLTGGNEEFLRTIPARRAGTAAWARLTTPPR